MQQMLPGEIYPTSNSKPPNIYKHPFQPLTESSNTKTEVNHVKYTQKERFYPEHETILHWNRSLLPFSWCTERANFHWRGNHQRSLRRIGDRKLFVHEATVNNRFILRNNLVTIAALQAFLVSIALMGAVLHLLKIPNDTELANRCNKVALLFPVFSYLLVLFMQEQVVRLRFAVTN